MLISTLDKKLIRDLVGIRGQAIAIMLVIAAGIATFVMSLCAMASLETARDIYYNQYRFGHVFAQLKRAPESVAERLKDIPGVAVVETRIVFEVTIDVPDMDEPAVGRLISMPDQGHPKLNDVHLRSGRFPEADRGLEAIVGESFAEAHQFQPGDSLQAIVNGRRQSIRIVGIGLSPEYVLQIGGGSLLPEAERFGVFWLRRRPLEAAFNMEGAFNNVSLSLTRTASQADVIDRVDHLLEPYGCVGADGRDRQVSHRYLSDEIRQLQNMAFVAPAIFLSVAAFLLNVVVSRIVSSQREQIAALKALGFSNRQVGLHYFKMAILIAIGGIVLGVLFGAWLGRNLTTLYTEFYKFPIFYFRFDPAAITWSSILTLTATSLGTLASVRRATQLPPAQAMRPEPPPTYRPTLIERLGLQRHVPQITRMILRNIQRRRWKSLVSVAGIAMAIAVLILGSFSLDAIQYIMDFQFRLAQRQDVSIAFVEPLQPDALHEVRRMTGVLDAEPMRAVPVEMIAGPRHRRLAITGLDRDAELFRLLDVDERPVTIPESGVMLSDKLARILQVGPGDEVEVQILEGERPRRSIPVSAVITEFQGTNAYMNRHALNRFMREDAVISGAFLRVREDLLPRLYHQLKQTPRVASVTIKSAALRNFEKSVAENLLTMRFFNVLFASIIAFGVVYNNARISLAEQSRELATLRVIGFTRHEVSGILLGELAFLTVVAIPFGCLLGYGFAALTIQGLDTEMYRIPLVVNRSTFGFAIVTVIVATIVSGMVVRRRIDHLDLVSVLKTRE